MRRNDPLAVLDRYLGTWEITIQTEGAPWTGGEYVARWVLDGSFVEKTGYLSSGDHAEAMETTTWMTFDHEEGVYRMWSFMSGGVASEAVATWNPDDHSMTEKREDNGMTTIMVTRFVSDERQEWAMEMTGPDGSIVGSISGSNRRLKV